MSENQVEEKKGWSWLGFFFAPFYYAGYGQLAIGILFVILWDIPFVGLIVAIYAGLRARKELPIKQQEFQWKDVGIVLLFNIIFITVVNLIIKQNS